MRDLITLVENLYIAEEAFKLPNPSGTRAVNVFKNPTKLQLKELIKNSRMELMRGMITELDNKWVFYVWPAYSLGHWNFISDMNEFGFYMKKYVSVFLSNDLEKIETNRDWKNTQIHENNGIYFCVSTPQWMRDEEEEIVARIPALNG